MVNSLESNRKEGKKLMKYKGIKDACTATRKTCRKDGYGLKVCIYRFGNTVKYHDDLTSSSFLRFNDIPDAVYYARYPMTMKEIEKEMDGENL